MTAIERTTYRRFTRAPSIKELQTLYTPTPEDVAFVSTTARDPAQTFALMILLKVFQKLGYFPAPEAVPGAIISHIWAVMKLKDDVVPDITPRTLYKYHAAIRTQLKINYDIKEIRPIAGKAIAEAVLVMDDPADLINVAIETLIVENCELPAFSTLETLVSHIRKLAHGRLFQTVFSRLSDAERTLLEHLIDKDVPGHYTDFNRIKEAPKSATLSHLDECLTRLIWLLLFGNMERLLEGIPAMKIATFAAEARALHATNLWDFLPPKRFTLLICLLRQAMVSTRDEVVDMFLKRLHKLRDRAKEELELLREKERGTTEHLITVFSDLLQTTTEAQDRAEIGRGVSEVLSRAGGAAHLLDQCENVSAHHGNRYQPLLWRFYASSRKALFRVIKTLDLRSTTRDQTLMNAVAFILEHEQDPKKFLPPTLDLSFASGDWQRTVLVRRMHKDYFIRQHLETCVFSYVAAELKSGDLCVRGSEHYADYREQLMTWEAREPKVAEYCQKLSFPTTADAFVEQLQTQLTQVSTEVDRGYPDNKELVISDKGEPVLKKTPSKVQPKGLAKLEAALHARMPEQHLLDILCRMDHWTNWSRHLGPLSGSDSKMEDVQAHHILTTLAYATNLGPAQMATHLRGGMSAETIAHISRRHVTTEKLEAANREIINRFSR
jgi:uncharacterized protein DUF4158/Tn3 transposase DDE domain-containing protein